MIETDTTGWDHLPTGEIEISPVAGWAVATAPNTVLLRLEILTETGQIGTAQLAMPSDQAEELGKCLAWMAQRSRGAATYGTA